MYVGSAAADITPSVGSILNGFVARLEPSEGVDLPLKARVLWLERGEMRALIVGLDILCLAPVTADQLARNLADDLGLPEGNVILAASHTHAGPMTISLRGLGEADTSYLEYMKNQVRAAAASAASSAGDVELAWGEAPVAMGTNRRQLVAGRGMTLGQNPEGPSDHAVRVAHFRSSDRSILLFEHATHPYCLGGDTNLISPDLFGHAAHHLEQQGYAVLYLNGCAGDIASARGFEGVNAAHEEGVRLAEAVVEAVGHARVEPDPVLCAASRPVTIPYDAMPPIDRLERELDRVDRTVRDEEREDPEVQRRLQQAGRSWLAELRDALQRGDLPPLRSRVGVVRIGRGVVVALPGEVFYEAGQAIAAQIAADPVCVAAYCHGYIGYIPVPEAYEQGGYEVEEAHRFGGLWRVGPETPALLRREVLDLWRGGVGCRA